MQSANPQRGLPNLPCIQHNDYRQPNNWLQLTRLACGKLEMPSLPECARMSKPLPEPPGS